MQTTIIVAAIALFCGITIGYFVRKSSADYIIGRRICKKCSRKCEKRCRSVEKGANSWSKRWDSQDASRAW